MVSSILRAHHCSSSIQHYWVIYSLPEERIGKRLSWRRFLSLLHPSEFWWHGNFCSFREFQNPKRSNDQQSQGNQIENISLISSTEAEDNGANVAEFNSPYQAVVTPVKWARPYPTTSTPVASKQAIFTPDISGSEEKPAKRARVYTEQSDDQLREPQNGIEDDDQIVLEHKQTQRAWRM